MSPEPGQGGPFLVLPPRLESVGTCPGRAAQTVALDCACRTETVTSVSAPRTSREQGLVAEGVGTYLIDVMIEPPNMRLGLAAPDVCGKGRGGAFRGLVALGTISVSAAEPALVA